MGHKDEARKSCSSSKKSEKKKGGVVKLTEEELKSPELQKKVKKMLKIVNATRCIPLRLVEIVSGERQIVDGVKENMLLKLRESGRDIIMTYNLYNYEKAGDEEDCEVRLTLVK